MAYHIDHITCPRCYIDRKKTVIMKEVGFNIKFKKCFKCGYIEPAENNKQPSTINCEKVSELGGLTSSRVPT